MDRQVHSKIIVNFIFLDIGEKAHAMCSGRVGYLRVWTLRTVFGHCIWWPSSGDSALRNPWVDVLLVAVRLQGESYNRVQSCSSPLLPPAEILVAAGTDVGPDVPVGDPEVVFPGL